MKKGDLMIFNENQKQSNPAYTGYLFVIEEVQDDGNLKIRCLDPYPDHRTGNHKETRHTSEKANKCLNMVEEL